MSTQQPELHILLARLHDAQAEIQRLRERLAQAEDLVAEPKDGWKREAIECRILCEELRQANRGLAQLIATLTQLGPMESCDCGQHSCAYE